ncbi:S-layer homology domain-containing protein [Paenibacillus luteus]|uniref:S-layer homology domain-containing protein n=1 Tax=Paenibacillus luteus TaxID=2545753 RepID=UPI0011450B14|nr:S-layer homology domain-containing protein [Paenibacillus luteus]
MREKSNSLFKQNSQQPHVFRGGEIKVMKKKIAAFVLAAALVLPTSLTAFAATPTDVVGKPIQSAVEELTALGIIGGYEDGTFKPDNEITRAELAKIIVIASGNGAAAITLQTVKSAFTDVKSNEWYTGYINAAQAKGYIQGYNGKFRPSDNVKNEEVIAVLVRALGYQENKLTGAWPYNYLIAAQSDETNIVGNVTVVAGKNATRGDVAQLSSNTLNQFTVSYNADGNLVVSTDKKLINKIGDTTSGVLVNPTVSNKLLTLSDKSVTVDDNFIVTGGKSLVDLLGHNVTLLWNKAKTKVIAITDNQDSSKIVEGKVTVGGSVYSNAVDTVKLTVGTSKNTYSVANDVTVYNNFVKQNVPYALATDASASIILDAAGKVRFVNVTSWENNAVVAAYEPANPYRVASLEFKSGVSVNILAGTKITINGAAAVATDLKEFDVARYVLSGNDAAVLEVTRKAVTGTVASKRAVGTTDYYTIAGTEYKDASSPKANLSFSTDYTVYLNNEGSIAYATAPNAATASAYGVLTEAPVQHQQIILDGGITAAIYTKVVYYSVKDAKNVTVHLKESGTDAVTGLAGLAQNDVVKFTLKDGAINAVNKDTNAASATNVTAVSATSITVGGATYLINSNTVAVDATGLLSSKVVASTTLDKIKVGDHVVIGSENKINASVIVLTNSASSTTTKVFGLFDSKAINTTPTGAKTYTVYLNVSGTVTPYNISETGYNALNNAVARNVVSIDGVTVKVETTTAVATTTGQLPIASVDSGNRTFNTVAGNVTTPWIATSSVVYLIDANDNLTIGSFTDLRGAASGLALTTPVDVTVTVYDAGTDIGSFNLASVIVVKKNS